MKENKNSKTDQETKEMNSEAWQPEQAEAAVADQENEAAQPPQDFLETLKSENVALQDKFLRLMAEFDNYKRRTAKDYERLVASANERLMVDLIEVRENFERAMRVSDEAKSTNNAFYEGLLLIFSKFEAALKKHGLTVFAQAGEKFDPQIHDALMRMHSETIPEGDIMDVYEKGYRLNNLVIRHARVIVSGGPTGDAATAERNQEKAGTAAGCAE